MIDRLPLDLFADSSDRPTSSPDRRLLLAYCQWCGVTIETTATHCPECDALLLTCALGETVTMPWALPEPSPPDECQWCDATIPAGASTCPACGADLPDPSLQIPGVNVPLSASDINALMSDADELF